MTERTNRYPGRWCQCGHEVAAGDGEWRDGDLACEPGALDHGCSRWLAQLEESRQREREAPPVEPRKPTQADLDAAEADARQDRKWEAAGLTRCLRCGGAGESEMWRHTGGTCFGCGGLGATPTHARKEG